MFLNETNRKPNLLLLKQIGFIFCNSKKSKGKLLLAFIWPFCHDHRVASELQALLLHLSQEERRKESIYMLFDQESKKARLNLSSSREDFCLFLPITWENYISLEPFALYSLFEIFLNHTSYTNYRSD